MNAAEDIVECLRGNCTASTALEHNVVKACGETFLDEDRNRLMGGLSTAEVPFLASRW